MIGKLRLTFKPAIRLGMLILLFLFNGLGAVPADPASLMGSGNIHLPGDGSSFAKNAQLFRALNYEGVGLCRIPLFPNDYFWSSQTPTPAKADDLMLQAHRYGVTPNLLFEYYSSFPTPIGTYDQWYRVGRAFAERFSPNSVWWKSRGIRNFGVTIYEAINEPDISKLSGHAPIPGRAYHDALKGLADGVHSINSALKVNPGGFGGVCANKDYTLQGLGPVIADLWNNGTLDGVDLHTYGSFWSPLSPWKYSAQHDFDAVKKACGITRDINFYASEFNYNAEDAEGGSSKKNISESEAASYRLTCIWDNLGIVGKQGQPVTRLALIWTLFDTASADPAYGLCTALSPFKPTMSASVYRLVAQLTAGMDIVSSSPKDSGIVILRGSGKSMWVWQDRINWTRRPGSSFKVTGISPAATKLKVYGYDGLRAAYTLSRQTSYTVNHLPGNETYMFLAQ